MDVYKLRIEDTESKTIDKDRFESETFRREPWYQPGSAGKLAQFAVCRNRPAMSSTQPRKAKTSSALKFK